MERTPQRERDLPVGSMNRTLDIEETVGRLDAKRYTKKRSATPTSSRSRVPKTGINQAAPLGPQSESLEIPDELVPLIKELATCGYDNRQEFNKVLGRAKRKYKYQGRNSDLLRVYKLMLEKEMMEAHPQLPVLLRTKLGKSASGILSVTVFTSPYPEYTDENGKKKVQRFTCKWNCYYCPNHPNHPRSYLPDEPGCLRAERLGFVAVDQVVERVETLRRIGHPVDKLEVLVLGGTWESYPEEYQETFIRDLFYAANTFFDPLPKRDPQSLPEEQAINETTRVKIIGLTLETRPDTIDAQSIRRLRYYGCTRLQLGVQHTDDSILELVNRQHTKADTARALRILKDNCYKVDIHLMPDLPGATPEIDRDMFDQLLGVKEMHSPRPREYHYDLIDETIQADQWKIYPCEVTPWTVIEKWYKAGTYKPYADTGDILQELLMWTKSRVFPWIRLNRVIRDIPNQHILGGNSNTNLRQALQKEMKARGMSCRCIRCREVGLNSYSNKKSLGANLVVRKYNGNSGVEYFLSFESDDEKLIYGFCRLRISDRAGVGVFPELVGAALVRELHVYGQLIPTYTDDRTKMPQTQHVGFGKKLMKEAEKIAKSHGKAKIAVIAGIGTRNYYRKLGYHLHKGDGGFLLKSLSSKAEAMLWFLLAAVVTLLALFFLAPVSLPQAMAPKFLEALFNVRQSVEL